MARAALRRFVRSRAIECVVPAGAAAVPDPAECSVAGRNLAEWLVAQGWASRSGEDFAEAEAAARERKLGIWSETRPGGEPAVAAGAAEAIADEAAAGPQAAATP
jgi:endonuclease YncB( thermonuclease family)